MKKAIIFLLFIQLFLNSKAAVHYFTINETITYPATFSLDLNQNGLTDYDFIIDTLPTGELYCKVEGVNWNQVLDNSNIGYPDALDAEMPVTGYWNNFGVLGTLNNNGMFNGKGDKYLGLMLHLSGSHHAGWVKLNLSEDRSQLIILEAGYNDVSEMAISTGQKFSSGISRNKITAEFEIMQNGKNILINSKHKKSIAKIAVYCVNGSMALADQMNSGEKKLSLQNLPDGFYFLSIETADGIEIKKIYLIE